MAIVMFFVLIFTIILLIFKIKNKYTFVFGAGFLTVNLLMLTLVFYTIRINNYKYFFQFEFYIIKYLNKISISYYDTKNIMVVSVVVFLSLMLYLFAESNELINVSSHKKKYIFMFVIASAVFVYLNSNSYSENIYLNMQYTTNENILFFYRMQNAAITVYSCMYIIIICALPYFNFAIRYRMTRLFYKKKHIMSLGVSVAVLQGIFLFVLFCTPLRYYLGGAYMYDITAVSNAYTKLADYYVLIIIGMMVTVLSYVLIKSYVLSDTDIFKSWRKLKSSKFIMKDVRHIFHTFKNLLLLLTLLNNKAIEDVGKPECMDSLLELKKNIAFFSDKIKKYFAIYNYPVLDLNDVSIADCIGRAVERTVNMYGVKVELSIECEDTVVYGDLGEFTEMFYNLLSNSADALKKDGKIIISIWREDKWICVSIWDNGVGMDKKMQKNLFKPFVSGKKTFDNWGIGLAYVKKIVDASYGFINVKSSMGEYTEFQVILPCNK